MDLLLPLLLLTLIAANAFFVVGEYAVVTARRGPLTGRAEAGDGRARVALLLMDDPVRVISTVQVGITAVGILAGAVAEPAVDGLLGDAVPGWLTFVVAFGGVTYLSVVLGELVPKSVTLDRAEAILLLVARPVALMGRVLRPGVWVLERSAALLLRPLGIRDVVAGEGVRTPEELREVVDEAEESGVIERAQEELIHRVFDFADQEVADVMVPAADVVWIEADVPAGRALEQALAAAHSRFPVGRGGLDHVVGLVHLRDLAGADPAARVGELTGPAYVVPATKDLGALLRELREERRSVAVVADEYGRTLGIVSLEDVLEELVGEIDDEFDLPDGRITRADDGALLVAGSISLDDLGEQTGCVLPRERSRTVAGLLFDTLGRRPVPGDEVDTGVARLHVVEVDGQRITRVRVEPTP
ncbi:MAG: HlyC/CorC family transporter [Solirubrobacterales bacterium]|nr:HlyC/CorC family transporter [Solirubrobacterales bacterium]